MAKHNVFLVVPSWEMNNVDAQFNIIKDDVKLGQIRISKGGFDYFPSNSKKPIKMSWTQFDKMVKDWKEG